MRRKTHREALSLGAILYGRCATIAAVPRRFVPGLQACPSSARASPVDTISVGSSPPGYLSAERRRERRAAQYTAPTANSAGIAPAPTSGPGAPSAVPVPYPL